MLAVRRAWLAGALTAALATACVAWQQSSVGALSQPHPQRAKYQIWVRGHSHHLHGIRTTTDSVFGVPTHQAPDCATCVLSFALSSVDSVRTLKEGQTAGRNVMWITLVALGALLVFALSSGGLAGAPSP